MMCRACYSAVTKNGHYSLLNYHRLLRNAKFEFTCLSGCDAFASGCDTFALIYMCDSPRLAELPR